MVSICLMGCDDTTGPPPIAPENVNITESKDGYLLTWTHPKRGNIAIAYFTVDWCYDDQWRRLTKTELKPIETSYFGKERKQSRL